MAQIAVIGGGFAGMAASARLAKLGHEVTLLERAATLGGALGSISQDGFTWDAGATSTLLPAVIRDLFRKSGRPLEKEVDLQPLEIIREHRFADGTHLALPGGSRAAQLTAVDQLGPGLGQAWVDHVASYRDTWDLLRRDYFEKPYEPTVAPRATTRLLNSRDSLHARLRTGLRDERLRLLAGHALVIDGHDLRKVPAWAGLGVYLEQRFGAWTLPNGMAALGQVLAARLATRRVRVHTQTPVLDLVIRGGRVVGVRTADGEVAADEVVVAIDPRRLPALAPHVRKTRPVPLPSITHLGLREAPELPHQVVLHGDPTLVLNTRGNAWTVVVRGQAVGDPVDLLAARGIEVRSQVMTRIDRSPDVLAESWGGSPLGIQWQGRQTVARRLGPHTPIPGVHAAGAHANPGAGLPSVGLSAALVAQTIGPAIGPAAGLRAAPRSR